MASKQVNIGQAFQYGWNAIKKDFWYFVGLAVVFAIITSLTNRNDDNRTSMNLLNFLITTWLTCGLLRIVIDYYDNKKRPFADLFTQFKYFWGILLSSIVLGIIFVVGFIVFIIPGIYLALRYQFTQYFIVEKNMGLGEAMKQSSELTNGVKWPLLGFAFAALGVFILGAIVFGVGIFVAIPIVWLAHVYLYKTLQSGAAAVSTPSK